jgi:hypothetical protein
MVEFVVPCWQQGEHFALEVRQRAYWVHRPGEHWSAAFRVHFEVGGDATAGGEPCHAVVVRSSDAAGGRGRARWTEVLVRKADLKPIAGWQHDGARARRLRDDFLTELMSRHTGGVSAPDDPRLTEVEVAGRSVPAVVLDVRPGQQLWCRERDVAPFFLRHASPAFRARLLSASRWN